GAGAETETVGLVCCGRGGRRVGHRVGCGARDEMKLTMREALIVLAAAGLALAQPAPHYIGAGGRASSNCPGAARPLAPDDSRTRGKEYAPWSAVDKHARAYKALVEPRGKRMAEILKIADAAHDKRCAACHVIGSPERSITDGVACEACHGP